MTSNQAESLATSITMAIVFAAIWSSLSLYGEEIWRATFLAFLLTNIVFIGIRYSGNQDGFSTLASKAQIITAALFGTALIFLSLLADAYIAHVDLFDTTKWHILWTVGSPIGFGLTALLACIFPFYIFAALVRFYLRTVINLYFVAGPVSVNPTDKTNG